MQASPPAWPIWSRLALEARGMRGAENSAVARAALLQTLLGRNREPGLTDAGRAGDQRDAAFATLQLDQLERDVETEHQDDGADGHPHAEPLLQLSPDRVAVAVEQDRDHEEAAAARHDRAQDE